MAETSAPALREPKGRRRETPPISFKRHRFPPVIIQHAVWPDARFTQPFREVEDLLAERGIGGSNETVRRRFLKLGRLIAGNLRRSRPRASDRRHLDETVIEIRDRRNWLWRAVDDDGEVLDVLVQPRRYARSPRKLLRKRLKKRGFAPTRVTTDKHKSYPVAIRDEHRYAIHDQARRADNRAENSRQPVRSCERKQQRFTSPGSVQRFLLIHAAVCNAFYVQRHLRSRRIFKQFRADAFAIWRQSWLVA
jgi:putative transposase